ncbi:MAG: sigma-70 family RNA polymerase sigma factor [Actinobacteria bacterium]|nr:MAG: sigma-70 family RNA polymerase sigma factor [Actinomycetota bacterium]
MCITAENALAAGFPSLLRLRPAAGGGAPVRREVAQLSDEALVEAIARSDEAALGELYDRFGRVAYGLALKILRDAALAEDAVQEAFLQVWRGAGGYRADRARASTWLLTFVHRRAVDLVRREERRRAEPADSLPEPSGPGADEAAAASSRREIVQQALQRLPAEQREPIELAYYGGLTQSELAERLGQPLGTIKSRMFTGLQRLRGLLVEAGFDSA